MQFEMPYAAACLNPEMQDRLAVSLTQWASRLNARLREKKRRLITVDRAQSRQITGRVVVSDELLGAFPASYRDEENRLRVPLVLNGVHLTLPMPCWENPAKLSLTFIQAEGTSFDGLAVHLWLKRQEASQSASASADAVGEWVLLRPCFLPRLHGAWLSQLLVALQAFDPGLAIREVAGGILPCPAYPADSVDDFANAMESLAESYYLDRLADAEDDGEESP
jgi:hypothetical protein